MINEDLENKSQNFLRMIKNIFTELGKYWNSQIMGIKKV